jgi:hypothetical protein
MANAETSLITLQARRLDLSNRFVVVTAGFSSVARAHVGEVFRPYEDEVNVIYDEKVAEMQKKAIKEDTEQDLYRILSRELFVKIMQLRNSVWEMAKSVDYYLDVDFELIGKSAGAAVLLMMVSEYEKYGPFKKLTIQEPAPVKLDRRPSIEINLYWCTDDPKIPYDAKVEESLGVKCHFFHGKTHDFISVKHYLGL